VKTVVIACGGGIATSTVIANRVREIAGKIKINIIQTTLYEMPNYLSEADLVVTSSPIQQNLPVPYVLGTCFLTGIGTDDATSKILEVIKKQDS
jgi:PTS system galactitol-specific IIB component